MKGKKNPVRVAFVDPATKETEKQLLLEIEKLKQQVQQQSKTFKGHESQMVLLQVSSYQSKTKEFNFFFSRSYPNFRISTQVITTNHLLPTLSLPRLGTLNPRSSRTPSLQKTQSLPKSAPYCNAKIYFLQEASKIQSNKKFN